MSKQYYGIKYPFNEGDEKKTFFDLNENNEDGVRSMLLHIIFTPKGQRLRRPNFGTNLIKFIFEPNDNNNWENIKNEIRQQISLFLPQVIFNDIKVNSNGIDNNDIFVEIDYSVKNNVIVTKNKTLVKL